MASVHEHKNQDCQLLALALSRHEILLEWISDVAIRFSSFNQELSKQLELVAQVLELYQHKLNSCSQLCQEYWEGVDEMREYQTFHARFKTRFKGQSHYLILDSKNAKKVLNSLRLAICDMEISYAFFAEQTHNTHLQCLYRELQESLSFQQHQIWNSYYEQIPALSGFSALSFF